MSLQWTTLLNSYPSQSWTFVLAADNAYSLFLSWRIDCDGWRAFVVPNARSQRDLFGSQEDARWSQDVFAAAGIILREEQLTEAQAALVRLLASRLGLTEAEIVPARNGRPVAERKLTLAQLNQIARIQPARRR